MQGPAALNPPVLSFLEFVFFYSLPFQIKKFGLRNPGYPQIPKRFLLKQVRCKNKKASPPHEKITVS